MVRFLEWETEKNGRSFTQKLKIYLEVCSLETVIPVQPALFCCWVRCGSYFLSPSYVHFCLRMAGHVFVHRKEESRAGFGGSVRRETGNDPLCSGKMFHFADLQRAREWQPEAFYPQLGICSNHHEFVCLKVAKLFRWIVYILGLPVPHQPARRM